MNTIAPSSVSMRLPVGWIDLDPRADDIIAELRRAVGSTGEPAMSGDDLISLLAPLALDVRRLAASQELIVIGLFSQVIPTEDMEIPLVVSAHAVLAISPSVGDAEMARAELLLPRGDGTTVAPVSLPAGEGVREHGLITITNPQWDGPVQAYQQRICVPVPGTDRLAVLSFLTPNLALTDAFADVFDAVAETLTFYSDN